MQHISPTTIEELASHAGLPLPAERRAMVAALLQQLIDAVSAMDAVELADGEPALSFDPRWED
jgi:hypothetical protein